MCPRSKFSLGQCVVAALAIVSMTPAAFPAEPRYAPLSSWDIAALERARAGAIRRLRVPECQKVLSDFTDPQGRTLLANLEPWQRTPSEYLQSAITFLDGSRLENCRKGTVMLVTSRGQLPIFVCPAGGSTLGSRFARVQIETPALAEVMVIHEMLHTLGLGENPPTTFEITDRVMARCR
jgi:hypothetical protein